MSEEKKRNWFVRHKILTAIIVFVIIGVIGSSGSSSTTNTGSTTTSDSKSAKQQEQLIYEEVNTVTFIDDFDINQLSAEKKYKDKGVKLTAKINNISEDVLGDPFLSLEPTTTDEYYYGTHIQCMFEDENALMNVANGQVVTVQGIVKEQTLGIIGLKKCQIVE